MQLWSMNKAAFRGDLNLGSLPDKGQVNAQTPVYPGAGKTDKHAVWHGRPSGVLSRTVKAHLQQPNPQYSLSVTLMQQ